MEPSVAFIQPDGEAPLSTTDELHSYIEDEYNKLTAIPWTVSIPFDMMQCLPSASETTAATQNVANILEYCNPSLYKKAIIRFPLIYNQEDKGIKALREDLQRAALQHSGARIIGSSNCKPTSSGSKVSRWELTCNHAQIYRGQKLKTGNPEYRKVTLHNDGMNTRGPKGMSMPKKTSTTARFDKKAPKCPFLLPIYHDGISFFISGGLDCANHQYHVRLDSNREMQCPTALLLEEDRQQMSVARQASATTTVARNMHFIRAGSVLTKSQVAHVFKTFGNENYPEQGRNMSPTDKLVHHLEHEGAGRCFLYHSKGSEELKENTRKDAPNKKDTTSINESTPPVPKSGLINEAHSLPSSSNNLQFGVMNGRQDVLVDKDDDIKDVYAFSTEHRKALEITDDQDLMIACARVGAS